MFLFVDLDSPDDAPNASRELAPRRLRTLLDGLGPYGELVQVVLSSPWAAEYRSGDLRAELGVQLPAQIVGILWDDAPPLALSGYEHILYWLTRRHVWRLPSWLAVLASNREWPPDRSDKLVAWADPHDGAAASEALRARLERYYWFDLWWGEEPPPDNASRWRAHALMVAWSLPRHRWPRVLGRTAVEFEARLDLLLTLHAGAQRHVRAGIWYPHWVHLPRSELGMQRPIDVIETQGLEGIQQVLAHVWQRGDAVSR